MEILLFPSFICEEEKYKFILKVPLILVHIRRRNLVSFQRNKERLTIQELSVTKTYLDFFFLIYLIEVF